MAVVPFLREQSVRQPTIDLIKLAITECCRLHKFVATPFPAVDERLPPTNQLQGVRIVKQYRYSCTEYPALGLKEDFQAGVTIEICETDPDMPMEFAGHVIMKFTADHKSDATHWIGMSLTFIQQELNNPRMDWRASIDRAIVNAVWLEEIELGRYRDSGEE